MNQEILAIDRKVKSIHQTLRHLVAIDPMSAESWQAAWDAHPDLRAEEQELYRQRGVMQAQIAEAEYQKLVQRNSKRKAA